jgi:hypothetical protein
VRLELLFQVLVRSESGLSELILQDRRARAYTCTAHEPGGTPFLSQTIHTMRKHHSRIVIQAVKRQG